MYITRESVSAVPVSAAWKYAPVVIAPVPFTSGNSGIVSGVPVYGEFSDGCGCDCRLIQPT